MNGSQQPPFRKLRVFALDPSLATQIGTVEINEVTVKVPWEVDPRTGWSGLKPGPVGEYVEVVDYDPASKAFYAPVNLDEPALLAQDGLSPSEGNPQFHQQMVYAVAMTTIGHFENALGRVMLWSDRSGQDEENDGGEDDGFVRRLRIYPHGLREANAYYSPHRKALLFGYFPTSDADPHNAPGMMVFSCLSHDIVTHETTHALLDGIHPRFGESTNLDVLAFHEAFADLVAIFQHFSHPEVLVDQIARTRGDLARQSLLGQLAQQFGRAIGRRGALRDALGREGEDGEWRPLEPDARTLERITAPHARGAVLVAAVFDAFLMIYKARVADLLRIATQGTGLLPPGDIHPDLVQRLAYEAAKSARHILHMCIRALDYCPPVDITFGDFLRAIITADHDLNPDDDRHYRVAVIDAFRRRGIHPRGVRNLSPDTLRWPSGLEAQMDVGMDAGVETGEPPSESAEALELEPEYRSEAIRRSVMQQDIRDLVSIPRKLEPAPRAKGPVAEGEGEAEAPKPELIVDWNLESDRKVAWGNTRQNIRVFHDWLTQGLGRRYIPTLRLTRSKSAPPSVYRDPEGAPEIEIHAVRTALRRGAKGSLVTELVVEITQRRRGWFDAEVQRQVDSGDRPLEEDDEGDFTFRRGCTILISPGTMEVRRVIRTQGDIADDEELERVRQFLTRENPAPNNAFHAEPFRGLGGEETIARLHRLAG